MVVNSVVLDFVYVVVHVHKLLRILALHHLGIAELLPLVLLAGHGVLHLKWEQWWVVGVESVLWRRSRRCLLFRVLAYVLRRKVLPDVVDLFGAALE